jgi:CheY-like chemotaxis protein
MNKSQHNKDGEKEARFLQAWRLQRTAGISAVLSQLGHDLRQPLAAILGNAQTALQLLQNGQCGVDELKEILNDIILDDYRASGFIGDLSQRLHRGKPELDEVRLSDIAQESLGMLRSEISACDIQVTCSREAGYVVHADRGQLRQAITELLVNSIESLQHHETGPRRLEIDLVPASSSTVQLAVSDSGPGIPECDIPRVFDPFWTTKERASGLGLFICRSIIQAHGGNIRYQSNQEGGAVFSVSLPLPSKTASTDDTPGIALTKTGCPPSEREESGRAIQRVLLVDDSESYRRATWSMLSGIPSIELAGEAADGLDAVRKAGELKPDVILMDISLSGINGIDAASQIREVSPESKIIFLSQYDDPDIVRAVLHAGAVGYVLKMDSGKDLNQALSAALSGKTFLSGGVHGLI